MNLNLEVLYQAVHDLSFAVYVGTLVYSEFVLEPAASAVAPAQGAVVRRRAGERHMLINWSALLLLLITGVLRLGYMNLLAFPGTFFLTTRVASSAYGRTIFTMFGLWCVLAALGLLMTFALRPVLIGKIDPTLTSSERERRQQRMVSAARMMTIVMRADLAIAVVIAVLGVSLGSGGLI